MPDRDLARLAEQQRESVVPGLAIGAVELHRHDIVVTLPSLVEHHPMRVLGIDMQHCLMEIRLIPHGVEHAGQEVEEATTLLRHDLEGDEIRHWHERDPIGSSLRAKRSNLEPSLALDCFVAALLA